MPSILALINKRVGHLSPQATLGEAAASMVNLKTSAVLVVEDERALGIITESDLLRLMRRQCSAAQPVSEIMTRPVHCVTGDTEFHQAWRDAADRGDAPLVVTDPAGRPLGVVGAADVRRHLGPDFFPPRQGVNTVLERQCPRLPGDAGLDEALAAMAAVEGSCTVIVDGRQPVGILTTSDVVRLFLNDERNPRLAAVMSQPSICIRDTCTLADAARQMAQHRVRHLIVVDAAGLLLGALPETALLRSLTPELAEPAEAGCRASNSAAQQSAPSRRDERYQQALLDHFPHLAWLKDTESRFLAVNRAFAEAVSADSVDQLIGQRDIDIWPSELAERYRNDDLAVMASRQQKVVIEPLLLNHRPRWHETYKAPLVGRDGELLGTVGFAQDISPRHRSEEASLLRSAALSGLIRNEPLVGVLDLIALSVETEMPEWTCAIFLADDDGQHLRPFAAPRLPESYAAAVGCIPVQTGAGSSGTAAFLRQRVVVEDIATHPYWESYREAAREAGFAASWAEPILGPQGQLLGTFAAYRTSPGAPPAEQQELLSRASQLSGLILAHHQGTASLQQNLDTFRDIFDSVGEALLLLGAEGKLLGANKEAERLFGHPLATLPDLNCAELGAPGLNDPTALGQHIEAARAGKPQYFEWWCRNAADHPFPADVRLHACTYFGQPALVASVVDISERKQAALRLKSEYELAQALAAGLQRDEVFRTILKAALNFPDLNAGCIYCQDSQGGYRLVAQQGLSEEFVAKNRAMAPDSLQANGIRAGRLICSCTEYYSHCNDPALIATPQLQAEGLRCLTLLPVMVADQAVACLFLAGRQSGQISPDTLKALETLTSTFAQTLLRLEAQEEAVRLQHNLGGLFNTLTDFIFVFDTEGRIQLYNQAVTEQLGYGPNALRGQHIAIVHPPEDRETAGRYLAEMVAGQRASCPLPLLHANGERIMVESRIITGYWDGQPAIFGIARDIRERLIAEERQKLAASVFENAHEGIMITDANGRIVEVNSTFSELTGYARNEAIGRSADLLKSGHHDDRFYRNMWQSIRQQGYWRGEVWNRKKSGELFAELLTISSVRNRDGEISHFVGIFSDITVLKEHQQRLEHLAHFDALTQLPNRMMLGERMRLAMAQSERNGKVLAVCYLDLDGFKPVNDRYGHAIGDQLLIEVAQRLKNCVRTGDTTSRLGGDEFVLLFSELDNVRECERALARVIAELTRPFHIASQEISISASIGVTLYPQDGSDSDTLMRHADQAMYAAKQAGRNRFHLFDPESDRRARVRHEAVGRIREALAQNEFVLHYQPKVDMRQGTVIGAEALIRWQHPERGLLLPGEFLPDIEGSELSVALGNWVLREALDQLASWRSQGMPLTVSVNIAGNHLQAPGFTQHLESLLASHPNVPPECLELEVLETVALQDLANVAVLFAECRRFGVSFSLDDFGTGYSSLTYFRRLPADVLKIDQSFVRDMLDDPDDLAIVEGVIGLTKAFKRQVIAEGVETAEHGMILLQLGCDMAQGFGIARPMPAAELPRWVRDFQPDELWVAVTTHDWPREDLPMLIAVVEYKRWTRQLEAWLNDRTGQLLPPEADEHACRFGRWYDSRHSQRYRTMSGFSALAGLHRELHRIGNDLMASRDSADPAIRKQLLDELNHVNTTMTNHLDQIQTEVRLSALPAHQ